MLQNRKLLLWYSQSLLLAVSTKYAITAMSFVCIVSVLSVFKFYYKTLRWCSAIIIYYLLFIIYLFIIYLFIDRASAFST